MKYHLVFYFIHENAFKVYFVQEILYKFHQQKCTQSLSWIPIDEWMKLHSFLVMEFDDTLR
jgi:hypothetical protein